MQVEKLLEDHLVLLLIQPGLDFAQDAVDHLQSLPEEWLGLLDQHGTPLVQEVDHLGLEIGGVNEEVLHELDFFGLVFNDQNLFTDLAQVLDIP